MSWPGQRWFMAELTRDHWNQFRLIFHTSDSWGIDVSIYLPILRRSYLTITSIVGWLNLEFSLEKKKKREVTGWVLKTTYNLNNIGILKRIPLSPNLYYMGFELLCGLGIHRRRGKTIPLRNSSREERILQGITIGLVPTTLCVVYFRCPCLGCSCRRGQVSIFINRHIPECILQKKVKEDCSQQASRDGLSSSLSMSPTLLLFLHRQQVHRAALLCTLSTCWIWVLTWGCQMGDAYWSWGQTNVLYATSFVCLGAKAKFRLRNPKVLVAFDDISEICWPQSRSSVMVIPRYLVDWTCSNICWCNEYSLFVRKVSWHPHWVTYGHTELHLPVGFPLC